MHVTLSWDISAEGARWNEINEKLKAEIKNYSWVRPLKTVYVVKVASLEDRNSLTERLISVIKSNNYDVNVMVTPVMTGGRYNGYLPRDLWEKINERTG